MFDLDFNLIEVEPSKIPGLYETGRIKGSIRDPFGLQKLLAELETPLFGATAWELTGTGEGKLSLPYLAALKLDAGFGSTEAQTTGDCVSHGTRNSGMIDYCVDVLRGETEFRGRFSTENIYGARGHGGQGASCSTLARYVNSIGGFLPRKIYKDPNSSASVDLSQYKSSIGHNWGPKGTPSWLNKIAAECPAETISLVTTINEARDAISNGYGVNVCSGYGFSSTRNSEGIAEKRGSWSHAMAWVACNDLPETHSKHGGPLFLVQNSWGIWNSGPRVHEQPEGSFWITPNVAQGMLNARGAWVISSVKGFKRRPLDFLLI